MIIVNINLFVDKSNNLINKIVYTIVNRLMKLNQISLERHSSKIRYRDIIR